MTINNLFTKRDHRVVAGMTTEQAIQAAAWFWRSRQFGVNFSSQYALSGAQYYSKLGLRQQISVWVSAEGGGAGLDVSLSAELTDEGTAAGLVGAILVLPLTVAVGAVSYVEYENDANRLIAEFWSYLYAFPKDPKPPTDTGQAPSWAREQVAQPTGQGTAAQPHPCPSCGVPADADAKFCKGCGTRL